MCSCVFDVLVLCVYVLSRLCLIDVYVCVDVWWLVCKCIIQVVSYRCVRVFQMCQECNDVSVACYSDVSVVTMCPWCVFRCVGVVNMVYEVCLLDVSDVYRMCRGSVF